MSGPCPSQKRVDFGPCEKSAPGISPKASIKPRRTGAATSAKGLQSVALLSFFDGIAIAHQALLGLKIQPVVSWSWELHASCREVVKARHAQVEQFGDGRLPQT